MTKTIIHPPHRHHLHNLKDLKLLIIQQGYTVNPKSWENEIRAVAFSNEKSGWDYDCIIHLNKKTEVLEVTTPTRDTA